MTPFDRFRTVLTRLPLAASGAARRFAEDPERAKALAHRQDIPGLRGIRGKSQRQGSASIGATGADEVLATDDRRFWSAVAHDDFDVALSSVGDDPLRSVALMRLGGRLNEAVQRGAAR